MDQNRAIIARPTQLQKVLATSKKFGASASRAQFTERVIYDTLPLDGRTTFDFFQGCNSRRFPATNLTENKLQKQENMVVKFISLEVVTYTDVNKTQIASTEPLSTSFAGLYRSDLNFQIAQSVVLKNFPMDSINPNFNMYAKHTNANVVRLGVDLVIPEFLEFVGHLRTSGYTASTTKELMIKLHGEATIFSPRASF
jgi:hypothetical protein